MTVVGVMMTVVTVLSAVAAMTLTAMTLSAVALPATVSCSATAVMH